MKVVYGLGSIIIKKPSCVAIGVFDGVHLGHQSVLKEAVSSAGKNGLCSVVVTFDPHPDSVIKKKKNRSLIFLNHRLYLIGRLGVDVCIVVDFNRRFRKMGPEEFIENILIRKCRLRHLFVGENFLFGSSKKGDIKSLRHLSKKLGFVLHIKKLKKSLNSAISSTSLRSLIQRGKLKQAERLLGRKVEVIGRVVGGDRRGRRFGFPTANIDPYHEVVPPRGVYLIRAWLGKRPISGLANIGFRPTVSSDKKQLIEVHLFKFKRNIYGKELRILFLKKLRNEKKFYSVELLIKQLNRDINLAKHFFHL